MQASSQLHRTFSKTATSRPALSAPLGCRGRRSCVVRALLPFDPSAAGSSVAQAVAHSLSNVVATLAEEPVVQAATAAATRSDPGPFDFLAIGFENVLEFLNDGLEKLNVPYSYGFAIILLTLLVKLATFPLTQKQVQSTVAIQALQPKVQELKDKYANDQETLQLETARLYQAAGVNPLAGCLPTLATIPVFIGLYRALTLAAQDNLLNAGFLWIPSLAGPATTVQQAAGQGLTWLFPFVDGHPPAGWATAGAYLVMPVLLVLSQYASQRILSPPNNDPQQAQAQAILKFLPIMIGWFSLNVPAGLTLYWFVNNILSTAQQVYLKRTTKVNIPENFGAAAAVGPGVVASGSTPYISPKEEKVKRVSGKDINARRKRSDDSDVVDIEAEVMNGTSSAPSDKKVISGGKGEKFRARKAREVASKAAQVAAGTGASSNGTSDSSKSA